MEYRNPAETGSAKCVAVISVFERNESKFLRTLRLEAILHGHFDGNLDRRRSIIGIEDFRESGAGQQLQESDSQFWRNWIREPQERGMRYPFQLVTDCPVQDRMIVAMDIRPDGRITVQIASAEAVFEPRAATGDQNSRLVFGRNPVCHLREWVPDVGFVEFGAE